MPKITSQIINNLFNLNTTNINVDGLGVSDTDIFPSILTFLDKKIFKEQVNKNSKISAAFVKKSDAELLRSDIIKIIVDDPRWYFFSLLNALEKIKIRSKSAISSSAKIHSSAQISETDVFIGEDVVIEPGVVIMAGVKILRQTKIRAGTVIGVDGFEHKKTSRGLLSVVHDGEVIINERAEVGPNNTIIKGFSYRPTIIGEDTKLDAQVHYAHGVQSGSRCLIAASAMLAGHVTLGDDVWIGPAAAISNRVSIDNGSFITIGSTVTKDVAANEKVTGNFAIAHNVFMRNLVKNRRGL